MSRAEVSHQRYYYRHCGNQSRCRPRACQHQRDEGNECNPKIGAECGITVAPQRDIEVVLQPAGERHMPPAPKLLRVLRLVGRVEVPRQVEAHQHRHADGYIRVAGEVGIHLQRVGKERKQILKAAEQQWVIKHAVYKVHCQVIAQYDFLRQSVEYPKDRHPELPTAEVERLVQLWNELFRADYRARH